MRLKILLLVFFLTVTVNSVIAQNYPPFLKNSCWRVLQKGYGVTPRIIWLIPEKDTVISSLTYTKYIDSARGRLVAFLREDVPNKKVYSWSLNSEKILFDFSLKLGDTITVGYKYTVTTVDSVTISPTQKRRRLILSSPNYYLEEAWVEGIGSLAYPLWYGWQINLDNEYYLLCSYQNGIPVFNAEAYSGICTQDCCPTPPVVGNSDKIVAKWFPNPFSFSSTYISDRDLKNATIKVYNTQGQLVKHIKNISGRSIDLYRDNLPCGVYFVQLMQENNDYKTYKLVIQ